MLSEEERAALELKRAEAKCRCGEVWYTIRQLRKWLSTYEAEHYRWRCRFEDADRKLAEHDKLHKVTMKDKKEKKTDDVQLLVNLNKSQLLRIADELGIEIDMGGGDSSQE